MPFKSESQRRKFYALKSEGKMDQGTIDEWNKETKDVMGNKKLPDRLEKKASAELVKLALNFLFGEAHQHEKTAGKLRKLPYRTMLSELSERRSAETASKPRKKRSDAGKKRGTYKKRKSGVSLKKHGEDITSLKPEIKNPYGYKSKPQYTNPMNAPANYLKRPGVGGTTLLRG